MRLHTIVILSFFYCSNSFSQNYQTQNISITYKELLAKIAEKDTTIHRTSKKYNCSEDFFGTIHYYYKDKSLRLIKHVYKQGFYEEYATEYYYLKNDSLLLQTVISQKTHLNTQSFESKYKQMASAEKVVEITEQRIFLDNYKVHPKCYVKSHGMKLAEWDQDYFENLKFKESTCLETSKDIDYKYRLLRKAEQKLNLFRKNPGCIFNMW